jgi:hypothetical protein
MIAMPIAIAIVTVVIGRKPTESSATRTDKAIAERNTASQVAETIGAKVSAELTGSRYRSGERHAA